MIDYKAQVFKHMNELKSARDQTHVWIQSASDWWVVVQCGPALKPWLMAWTELNFGSQKLGRDLNLG